MLVLLVLVLGGLWLQKEREIARGGPGLEQFPLCPGLASQRVRALRIDHLERGVQIKLERDAAGRWFLTDPVAYPALDSLVRLLLTTLEGAQGEPVSGVEPAQVSLDPPLVVIECVQVGEAGESTQRIELGAIDVDPQRIFVRVPGHPAGSGTEVTGAGGDVFRSARTLATTLDRNPDDYRDPRATHLVAQDVISLRRRGEVYLAEEGRRVDLAFDALLESDGWKRVTLPTVSLDPSAIGLLVRGAAELSADGFADDSPVDLARYGLDPPALTVELQGLSGAPVELRFGHAPMDGDAQGASVPIGELTWYGMRAGFAHVWYVRSRDVELLSRPADLFFDQRVVRVLRRDVTRLELEGAGRTLFLERQDGRSGEGWIVREERAGAGVAPLAFPANPAAVEEALALLERVQLAEYLPRSPFEEAAPPLSFHVEVQGGARSGGRIGVPARDEQSGAQGRLFLRSGDEVPALIGDEVAELCSRPLDGFRAREVHRVQESLVRWIELEHGARTFIFVNTGDNVWNPRGQAIGAPADFVQSLDALLQPTARRWFEPGGAPERALSIGVRIQPTGGAELRFTLAKTADGRALCTSADGQCAEIDGALVDRLLALF